MDLKMLFMPEIFVGLITRMLLEVVLKCGGILKEDIIKVSLLLLRMLRQKLVTAQMKMTTCPCQRLGRRVDMITLCQSRAVILDAVMTYLLHVLTAGVACVFTITITHLVQSIMKAQGIQQSTRYVTHLLIHKLNELK